MTAVAEKGDLATLADPGRQWCSIADLPVKTVRRRLDGRSDGFVPSVDQVPNIVHTPRLKPAFADVSGVLVRKNPVELLSVSQRVLDQVHIFADPDINAVALQERLALRDVLENVAFVEGPVTGVS